MASGRRRRPFSSCRVTNLFAEKFGRPAKGNDKGKVENLVGYARRNFMVPIPRAASWEELNAQLAADCRARRAQRLRGRACKWKPGHNESQRNVCGHAEGPHSGRCHDAALRPDAGVPQEVSF